MICDLSEPMVDLLEVEHCSYETATKLVWNYINNAGLVDTVDGHVLKLSGPLKAILFPAAAPADQVLVEFSTLMNNLVFSENICIAENVTTKMPRK